MESTRHRSLPVRSISGGLLALSLLAMLALAANVPADCGHCGSTAETAIETSCCEPQFRLAIQAYTFNRFTFFEALDKAKAAGIRYVEAYPGQRLSPDAPSLRFDHGMDVPTMARVKKKLDETGIRLVNYGVVGLGSDEAANRKVFDFAKVMGIETIVSEPSPGSFPLIDKLAQEYGINVAIHNHPRPSRYWDPQVVIDSIEGCSKRIGACADTGHWMRSGIRPIDGLEKLEGHIISLHFKDLNKMGRGGEHDVVWGGGEANARALLEELKRQGFRGVFSIEYEHNWDKSLPEVTSCAKWFYAQVAELGTGASSPSAATSVKTSATVGVGCGGACAGACAGVCGDQTVSTSSAN